MKPINYYLCIFFAVVFFVLAAASLGMIISGIAGHVIIAAPWSPLLMVVCTIFGSVFAGMVGRYDY